MFTKYLMFYGIDTGHILKKENSTGKDKKREIPGLEPVSVDSAFCCFEDVSNDWVPRDSWRVLHFV